MVRRRLRPLLARLLLLGIATGCALLAGEAVVRVARPQEAMTITPGLYAPDPPRRYRLQPGFRGRVSNLVEFDVPVAINALGMRGSEAPPASPGQLRVLVLGDSFAFGVGAGEAETYPARLQAHLATRGLDAWVGNAGAPGFGVPDEVAWLEAHGRALRPDVAVITAFLANDLQDATPGGVKTTVVDGQLVVAGERGGARRWLYYHSHLFRLLKTSLLEGRLRDRLGLPEPWARRELRAELGLYGETLPPALAAGAEATAASLARLATPGAAGEAGVGAAPASAEPASAMLATPTPDGEEPRVVAVLVPALPQVDPARWRAVHEQLGVDPAQGDPRRPNRLFRELFERHGIPVLDPTDALAAAVARGEAIYYPRDQHLTPLGYDLLAREVAAFLLRTAVSPGT